METKSGKREEGPLECPEECPVEDKGQREDINNESTKKDNVRASSQRLHGLYVKGFVDNICVNWLVDTGTAKSILSRNIEQLFNDSFSSYLSEEHSADIFLADGKKVDTHGSSLIFVTIGKQLLQVNVLIADITDEAILGMDVLSQNRVLVDIEASDTIPLRELNLTDEPQTIAANTTVAIAKPVQNVEDFDLSDTCDGSPPLGTAARRLKSSKHHIEKKFIVFELCPNCGGNAKGSIAQVEGYSVSEVLRMLRLMNLACISSRSCYRHARSYINPSVIQFWKSNQQEVIGKLHELENGLIVAGDGRCDSPGHSAKFGSFTLIEQQINKVIDFELVQIKLKALRLLTIGIILLPICGSQRRKVSGDLRRELPTEAHRENWYRQLVGIIQGKVG
ncbi:hypothetical protein AC249_AIPGENE6366 [Exaiptasia diaphana]|nr:hypothetical protein AC249_AIPGENE6366 [Exaiptasia diaphana]